MNPKYSDPKYFSPFYAEYIESKYIEKDAVGRSYYSFNWSRMSITRTFAFDAAIFYSLTTLFVFSALFPNLRLLHSIFIVTASLLFLLSIPVGLSPILFNLLVLPSGYIVFVLGPKFEYISFSPLTVLLLPLLSSILGILSHRRGLKRVMKTYDKVRWFTFTWPGMIGFTLTLSFIIGTVIERFFPGLDQFLDQYIIEVTTVVLLVVVPLVATAQLYRVYLIKKYCPYLKTLADARYTNLERIKKAGRWGWK